MSEEKRGHWAGRAPDKDVVRNRIWDKLEAEGVAIGPAWSRIPNFAGADLAAWRLSQTPEWQRAKTVKCNPDPAQIPVRLRALYEGKRVFAPVPNLTMSVPYVRIDPVRLRELGVSFELAATAQGFLQHGEPIGFEDVDELDFCVVGSVAVSRAGGRTGKGAGFADLETAIFRELGKVRDDTPIVTTVHSLQLVEASVVPMQSHDSPLDMVATESELIRTLYTGARPQGVDWDRVQPDQYESIPFLTALRTRLQGQRA